jgi:hypothetical protein
VVFVKLLDLANGAIRVKLLALKTVARSLDGVGIIQIIIPVHSQSSAVSLALLTVISAGL